MIKEEQIVEVFLCPVCNCKQYIEWDNGETKRKISCSSCVVLEIKDEQCPGKPDADGNPTVSLWKSQNNIGVWFDCIRGNGEDFLKRELMHIPGADTSWQIIETGVSAPSIDAISHKVVEVIHG